VDKGRIEHSKASKNEKAKFDKEHDISMALAQNGYKIEMLKEIPGVSSSGITINKEYPCIVISQMIEMWYIRSNKMGEPDFSGSTCGSDCGITGDRPMSFYTHFKRLF
jgi:hypothetical protein